MALTRGAMVQWPFLEVPWGCLQFMIVVFPHLLFLRLFFQVRSFRIAASSSALSAFGRSFDKTLLR